MRIVTIIAAAAILILAVSPRAASSGAAPTLSGKMTQLKYLVGTWTCTTKVAPMGNMKAQTIPGKSVYWVEQGNVIATYYSSKPYSSSGFLGWMDSKKLWWSDGSDMYGSVDFETGKDSGTNVQVTTGTNWSQGDVSTARDTMTKIVDTRYSDSFQLTQNGKVLFQGTSACTKTSDKTM
jgi:hypothetical protein